jgi:hypothetical protein
VFQSITQTCCLSIFGAKRRTAMLVKAAVLTCMPFLAQADQDLFSQKIQLIAESNAMELGSVMADGHWTRIEFSKPYIDPVVVVEPFVETESSSYIAGIRNIDAMGFEINLKNCNDSTEIPLQETINYSVIDNSQLPSAEQKITPVRQRFAWGECAISTPS